MGVVDEKEGCEMQLYFVHTPMFFQGHSAPTATNVFFQPPEVVLHGQRFDLVCEWLGKQCCFALFGKGSERRRNVSGT